MDYVLILYVIKRLITINSSYNIVVLNQLKDVDMDQQTREWFWGYEGKQITLPDKFLPAKNFIEYHNDVVFLG
jgi:putative restriction endonuclease